MVTIEEISLLLTNAGLATKADMANMATDMATKADMASMVTKADFAERRVNISEPEECKLEPTRGNIILIF